MASVNSAEGNASFFDLFIPIKAAGDDLFLELFIPVSLAEGDQLFFDLFARLRYPLNYRFPLTYLRIRRRGLTARSAREDGLEHLVLLIMRSDNPEEMISQISRLPQNRLPYLLLPPVAVPFYFIDELSKTRVSFNVDLNTTYENFISTLADVSSSIANQVKNNGRLKYDADMGQVSAARFTDDDGPYLFRRIMAKQGTNGDEVITRSGWGTVNEVTFDGLFHGPCARQPDFSVEIQHTLQHSNKLAIPLQLRSQPLPFYFIDNLTNTRTKICIYPDTPYEMLTSRLMHASRAILLLRGSSRAAGEIENDNPLNDQYPDTDEGRWIARSVRLGIPTEAADTVSRSNWFVISPNVYHGMLERTQAGTVVAVEIEHTLQFSQDTGKAWDSSNANGRRGRRNRRPAPTLPPPPRPASPPASIPPPSPPPIPAIGRPIVRLSPVSVPSPVAVTPVATNLPMGVVDSADIKWYDREEELREWLRFGTAEVVESLDVWRGW